MQRVLEVSYVSNNLRTPCLTSNSSVAYGFFCVPKTIWLFFISYPFVLLIQYSNSLPINSSDLTDKCVPYSIQEKHIMILNILMIFLKKKLLQNLRKNMNAIMHRVKVLLSFKLLFSFWNKLYFTYKYFTMIGNVLFEVHRKVCLGSS